MAFFNFSCICRLLADFTAAVLQKAVTVTCSDFLTSRPMQPAADLDRRSASKSKQNTYLLYSLLAATRANSANAVVSGKQVGKLSVNKSQQLQRHHTKYLIFH